jgi:plastocyanin
MPGRRSSMRRLSKAILISLLLSFCFQGIASTTPVRPATVKAATVKIIELNFVFAPEHPRVHLGDRVIWWNDAGNHHTTTDESLLVLWDSGDMSSQDTFAYTFTAAGTYPYRCDYHEQFGMLGTVIVKDNVSPPSGPVGTVFTITVASVQAPIGFVYDVQIRNPVGGFRDWMTGVTLASASFDSTGRSPGTYGFRSRLRRVSDSASTDYSLSAPITVTAS